MSARVALLVASCLVASSALAQYKYVGPDGRVVYSDTPPPSNVKGVQKKTIATPSADAGAGSSAGANLPFALQQSSRNFPVTLYTAADCAGCDAGRAFLSKRGIPYSEKVIKTNEDVEALKKLANATSVPVLTVGNNKLAGFESGSWDDALDVAGYPKTSQLPPGYKPPAAAPVVAQKPAPTAPAQAKPDAAAPAAPAAPAPTADGGARPAWFKGF